MRLDDDVALLIQSYISIDDQIPMLGFLKCTSKETLSRLWGNIFFVSSDDKRIKLITSSTLIPYNEYIKNIGYTLSEDSKVDDIEFMSHCTRLSYLVCISENNIQSEWVKKIQQVVPQLGYLALLNGKADLSLMTEWPSLESILFSEIPLHLNNLACAINLTQVSFITIDPLFECDAVFTSVDYLAIKRCSCRTDELFLKLSRVFPSLIKLEFAGSIDENEANESTVDLRPFKQLETVKLMGKFLANNKLKEANILSFDFYHPLSTHKFTNLRILQLNWVLIHHDIFFRELYDTMQLLKDAEFYYELSFMNGLAIRGPVNNESPDLFKSEEGMIIKCVPYHFVLIFTTDIIVSHKTNFLINFREFFNLMTIDERVALICLTLLERHSIVEPDE